MIPLSLTLLSIPIVLFIVALLRKSPLWHRWKRINRVSQEQENDPKCMAPYTAQPIRGRERYRVMMDVRKLDQENWLTIDKRYPDEHRVRTQLLEEKKDKVLQCLPESYEACLEALEEVVAFLCRRYPSMFEVKESGSGNENGKTKTVCNKITGEEFVYGGDPGNDHEQKQQRLDPLEIAVRLTMEDLSILMKNEDDEYYL